MLLEGAPAGYRGSRPVEGFDDRLRRVVAEEAPRFYRKANRRGIAVVAAGLVATGLAVAAHALAGHSGPPLAVFGLADADEHAQTDTPIPQLVL